MCGTPECSTADADEDGAVNDNSLPQNRIMRLRGVAVHNLQQVDLDLPHRQLIAFCGVSGSGKSSLALDTLYAEGQRRYIESFSTYTRQYVAQLEKPAAELIEGIPPSIVVSRKHVSRSSRATVGGATQINEHLQLLFARMGQVVCHQCGREVVRDSAESAAQQISTLAKGTRLLLGFTTERGPERDNSTWLSDLKLLGFTRCLLDQRTCQLNDLKAEALDSLATLMVVLDRVKVSTQGNRRLCESLEIALEEGRGTCLVWSESAWNHEGTPGQTQPLDGCTWYRRQFSQHFRCDACDIDYPPPEPQLLSFNSPLGACPRCEGSGHIENDPCDLCHGMRLQPVAQAIRIGNSQNHKNICELWQMKISEALGWLRTLPLLDWQQQVGKRLLQQVTARLEYLNQVGVGHLTLARSMQTLSSGEAQRVALTTALGSNLVGLLYVLDEPSTGLHPADLPQLVNAIRALRDRGNTVIAVEHEPSVLRAADHLVELGPDAGQQGGKIIFTGTLEEMLASPESRMGKWLDGSNGWLDGPENLPGSHKGGQDRPTRRMAEPTRRMAERGVIRLRGAQGNNLKKVTVEFPLGLLCLVTGVSGAGKSTLVEQTLYPAVARSLGKKVDAPAAHTDLQSVGSIEEVVRVDSSPIGRTPRSNPVTYVKAFDPIRQLFAETSDAQACGFKAGHFSFNVDGGRCEACKGDGVKRIDMRFLADVYMRCQECQGSRFRREVLEVKYRNRHIADILALSVREAFTFFRGQHKILTRLQCLLDVGLDYLHLGQPANTLSGGEAQRLKLATYLTSARRGRTLFVLNEPTTGLHFSDVLKLLDCFDSLIAMGHSLIVVDHNRLLIASADHIIDLGPGAADAGGTVVATGTPEEIAKNPNSATGRFLR